MNVATLRLDSPLEDVKEWRDLFDLLAGLEVGFITHTGPQGPIGPGGAGGIDYVQDNDPGAVGAHKTWVRLTAPTTYAIRAESNTAWVFFSDVSGGSGSSSGVFITDNAGVQVVDSQNAEVML